MHYVAIYMGVFVFTSMAWIFLHVFDRLAHNTVTKIALAVVEDLLAIVSMGAFLVSIMICAIYFGGK